MSVNNPIPLIGTTSSSWHVVGACTDWIRPIEDAVYAYVIDKWNVQYYNQGYLGDNAFVFFPTNSARSGNSPHWIYISKGVTMGRRETLGTGGYHEYITNLVCHIFVERIQVGNVLNDMDIMSQELQRLFFEYNPHHIAGISHFDHVVDTPIESPKDYENPTDTFWHNTLSVDAYYEKSGTFSPDVTPYNPDRWSAGDLTYK